MPLWEISLRECTQKWQRTNRCFDRMWVVKMDEWGIIPLSHPDSCESYIQKHVLKPLEIPAERYVGFDSAPESVAAEFTRMQNFISDQRPFAFCILGFGKTDMLPLMNQQIFWSLIFIRMFWHPPEQAYGLCVGMKDILETRIVIFLITGKGKQEAIKQILERKIFTQCPASFLWLHPNIECVIYRNSM